MTDSYYYANGQKIQLSHRNDLMRRQIRTRQHRRASRPALATTATGMAA